MLSCTQQWGFNAATNGSGRATPHGVGAVEPRQHTKMPPPPFPGGHQVSCVLERLEEGAVAHACITSHAQKHSVDPSVLHNSTRTVQRVAATAFTAYPATGHMPNLLSAVQLQLHSRNHAAVKPSVYS